MSRNPMTRQSDLQRLQHRIMELARDKSSLEVRCAALLRVVNRFALPPERVATTRIAVLHGGAPLQRAVTVAQQLEQQGRVPVIRWARDGGVIAGIELSALATADECPAAPDVEMAVYGEQAVSA